MAVPKLCLVLGAMRRLQLKEFHYCFANGNTSGLLVSSDILEELQ